MKNIKRSGFTLMFGDIKDEDALEMEFNDKVKEKKESYPINISHTQFNEFKELLPYLKWSMLNRKIMLPFDENKKSYVSKMKNFKDKLSQIYINRRQDVLVSIIMPTFNRADIISCAIDSIIKQTYDNWELIIVDDGSTDNTNKIIDKYKDDRIIYIKNTDWKGVSTARNIGLKYSKGTYIAYLDSDNDWHKDYLLLMVNTLIDNPQFKSIYCAQEIYIYESEKVKNLQSIRFGLFHKALLENRNYIDMNVFIHHRDLYLALGGFEENMTRLVDWEIINRYSNSCFPYALPCILGRYYFGKTNDQLTVEQDSFINNLEYLQKKLAVNKLCLKSLKDYEYKKPVYDFFANIMTIKDNHKRKVTIIIPNYEVLDKLKICIEAIEKYTEKNYYDLIIIDNASSKDTIKYLNTLKNNNRAKVIFNDHNMGFTYAVNQGIKISHDKSDIVLLNNDAIVTEGWLNGLYEVVKNIESAGIVAPRQVLPPYTRTNTTHVPFCRKTFEIDVNLSQHHDNIINPLIMPEKGYVELSFVPFFCVLITRDCFNKVGLLDYENGRHYKSDRLYCGDVIEHGYKIIYTPNSKVYHLLQQSTFALKKNSLEMYKIMFVKNNWDDFKNMKCYKKLKNKD